MTGDWIYLSYLMVNNLTPEIVFSDQANPGITYGPYQPSNIIGNTIYFQVSGLDPSKCYHITTFSEELNNPNNAGPSVELDICYCEPSKDCYATYQVNATDKGGEYLCIECFYDTDGEQYSR